MTLKVEITSDFICPWCLVADTRLNRAIAKLETSVEIERIWYPFELNSNMPEAGIDRKTYRTNKFGSWEYSLLLDAKTVQAGKEDGIEFRYDLMKVTPNTLKAHRLTWLAGKDGKATEMVERILRAYFTEGQNIGDIETLANLAAEVGIDAEQAKAFLLSDEGIEEVKELKKQALAQNIHSVPTIRIGKEILVGVHFCKILNIILWLSINAKRLFLKISYYSFIKEPANVLIFKEYLAMKLMSKLHQSSSLVG